MLRSVKENGIASLQDCTRAARSFPVWEYERDPARPLAFCIGSGPAVWGCRAHTLPFLARLPGQSPGWRQAGTAGKPAQLFQRPVSLQDVATVTRPGTRYQ